MQNFLALLQIFAINFRYLFFIYLSKNHKHMTYQVFFTHKGVIQASKYSAVGAGDTGDAAASFSKYFFG